MDGCLKDGMEPKAPDKSSLLYAIENCKARVRYEPVIDALNVDPPTESKAVSGPDEPGLRALLDEAISYKTHKDTQGKSEIFKDPPTERMGVSDPDEPGVRALLDEATLMSNETSKDAQGKSESFKLEDAPSERTGTDLNEPGLLAFLDDAISCETPKHARGKSELFKLEHLPTELTAVSDLDEPGLRALLDEAISYKTPKDAHGKSELFKELLQSVDNDNKNSMRVHSERSRKPRRQSSKKDTEKSFCHSHGSLQDLNNVLSNSSMGGDVDQKVKDPASWKIGMSKSSSSPPQFMHIEDLIAAQRYDEGLPRKSNEENGSCDDIYQLRGSSSKSQKHPTASTSFELPEIRRTLSSGCLEEEPYNMELPSSSKSMNSMAERDQPSTSFCEKFSEKVKSYDENANSLNAAQERKGKCRRLKAKNDKNTILSEHIQGHRSDIVEDIEALMKYIESPTRTDSKNNGPPPTRTDRTDSRQRMNIQKSSRISNKMRPVRDKSSDTVRKGRKSKDDKFKKSSSLEEVCISTFEDLTSNVEQDDDLVTSVVNNSPALGNYGTHGSEVCASHSGSCSNIKTASACTDPNPSPVRKKDSVDDTDSDFLTVKKKQRKKKNTVFLSQRTKGQLSSAHPIKKNFSYQSKERNCYAFERHSISRRKSTSSVPSSEESEDTSDGDSVHSLPISSEACSIRTLGESCIKTVSYAAIAGAAPSPLKSFGEDNDSIEKTLSSPEEPISPESIPTVMLSLPSKKDKHRNIRVTNEDYPPLQHDSSNDMYVEYTVSVPKKEKVLCENVVNVEKTIVVKVPLTKKHSSKPPVENNCVPGVKRPAVILLDRGCSPCEIPDLEFGFEVNRKLLEEEESTGSSEEALEEAAFEDELPEEKGGKPVETPLKEVFRPATVDLRSDDPVISYLVEEWNKVVQELAEQENGNSDVTVVVYY